MHTLTLLIKMDRYQTFTANKRFYYMWRIHNQTAKHANKLINKLRHQKEYKNLLKALKEAKKLEDKKACDAIYEKLSKMREDLGLTKGGLETYASVMQKLYSKHISSQQAQKEADRVWKSVEAVLFGKGKKVQLKKIADFNTISSKSMNGCHYTDPLHPSQFKNDKIVYPKGQIIWMGETMRVCVPWYDDYAVLSLMHEIKYCEINRKMFDNGWHYYVTLYLKGNAPKKIIAGRGTGGIDPGVSAMCMVSDNLVSLDELAPRCKIYNKEISDIQRKMDRSRRINNPQNYNKDGTIKKAKMVETDKTPKTSTTNKTDKIIKTDQPKGKINQKNETNQKDSKNKQKKKFKQKLKWIETKSYKKLKRRLQTLYRKKTAYTKCGAGYLSNRYVENSRNFKVEEMDYQQLAKKSKKPATRQEKETDIKLKDGTVKGVHKFKRKKRYGKSVNDRSPGLFLKILEEKALRYGGTYETVDTRKLKASQYRHDKNCFEKIPLSQRYNIIDGNKVYRDPYSAYIIRYCTKESLPNRKVMKKRFKNFLRKQTIMVETAKRQYPDRPACFGF